MGSHSLDLDTHQGFFSIHEGSQLLLRFGEYLPFAPQGSLMPGVDWKDHE
jgi:hypothetical protein